MSSSSCLRLLSDLISQAVDNIEAKFNEEGLQYPRLEETFNPTSPAEAFAMNPSVAPEAMKLVAAAAQLSAIVGSPALSLYNVACAFHLSSALRVAIEGNVVEILRDHAEKGLHCADISTQNGMNARVLARVLRLLATHHVFEEVEPNKFRNNRLSSTMDTMKTLEELKTDKHRGSTGMAAILEHTCDDIMSGSVALVETIRGEGLSGADDPRTSPFSLAHNTRQSFFEWLEEPENEYQLKRFAAGMDGAQRMEPPEILLSGFNWGSLSHEATVVDVGGGIGHSTLQIYRSYPSFKYIVQDRPKVIEQANHFWMANAPEALQEESVVLQDHDFFTRQTVLNPELFMCRMVLHDFGRSYSLQILSNLRKAASSKTKLLIIDQIIDYACEDTRGNTALLSIKGAAGPLQAPYPLIANFGRASAQCYFGDLQMYTATCGEERTLQAFDELLTSSGWKIEEIFKTAGLQKQILAVPN